MKNFNIIFNAVTIFRYGVIANFFDVALFHLSSLVTVIITDSGVMTISFYKGLTREIRKLKIPPFRPYEVCLMSGDWRESGKPNLA